MTIAVLSDIHGNLAALNAVIAHATTRGVDRFLNLGDICSGGLYPRETAERLIPLQWPTIRGNHERQMLETPPDLLGVSDRFAVEALTPEQIAWIASLPKNLRLPDGILMVHGAPLSDLDYFLETVTPKGRRAATCEEVRVRAGDADASLILCGHSHVARKMRLEDGRVIVNPGSVGLQAFDWDRPHPHAVETGSPQARYATVLRDGPDWRVAFHAVDYDWSAAAAAASRHGHPIYETALLTGRLAPDHG